jgi:pimeloyl-ACP methyl ester carboxylesterase
VDTYRTLAESGTEGAVEEEVAAFLAPFRADFAAATRVFVGRMFRAGADQDLADWVATDMAAAPPEIALDALRHAVTNESAAIAGLREAAVPVVAINPHDPPSEVGSLARHGVRVVSVPAVGHFVMLEDPAGFNQRLDETIAEFTALRRIKP